MPSDACPLCGQRKVRRACPALGRDICPVCCGTKRLVEIRCPAGCTYLATARAHPAAVAQRRTVRDLRFLRSIMQDLTEPQAQLLFSVQTVLRRQRPGALTTLTDEDVADATSALAATLETAARGVIYEHQPASLSAQRLVLELRATLEKERARGGARFEREAALVLRRVETAARTAPGALENGTTAYLDFVERLLNEAAASGAAPGVHPAETPSGLVLPPGAPRV